MTLTCREALAVGIWRAWTRTRCVSVAERCLAAAERFGPIPLEDQVTSWECGSS